MKKLICLILALSLCLSCVAFVSAEEAVETAKAEITYGADNLNNDPGELLIGFFGDSVMEGFSSSGESTRFSSLLVKDYFQKKFPNKTVIESNQSVAGSTAGQSHHRLVCLMEITPWRLHSQAPEIINRLV